MDELNSHDIQFNLLSNEAFSNVSNIIIFKPNNYINLSNIIQNKYPDKDTRKSIDIVLLDKDNQSIINRIREKENINSSIIFEIESSQIDSKYNGIYIHPILFEFIISWIDIYYQFSSFL